MQLTIEEQPCLSLSEAADRLHLKINTVRNYCVDGRLKAFLIGDRKKIFMVPISEIERYSVDKNPRGNPNFKKHGAE